MKITKITIENYKSIKNLEFCPNQGLNAFIGENSVGKSNIFNAICWLIGPVYPSFNSTLPQDHWKGDPNNEIRINITYDNGSTLELAEHWIDPYQREKSGLNLSGGYINNEDREAYCSAYLGIDREIKDYLPSNRWSLVGRILQQINHQFCSEEMDDSTGAKAKKTTLLKIVLKRLEMKFFFLLVGQVKILVMV